MSGHDWSTMVTVGRIIRPHGRRGEVVVASETDFGEDRFRPGATLYWLRGADVAAVEIRSSRPYGARWVVGVADVDSIEGAEALRGLEFRIPASQLQPLGPGGYYTHDLVGCVVETTSGEVVGEVSRVTFGSGAPLLAIERPGDEVLVPMVEPICMAIDVAGKRIVIDPPEGLIELNRRG